MHSKTTIGLAVLPALALAACSSEPEAPPERTGVLAVGSSTVFPFAQAIADATMAANAELAEITVESTGTAEGFKAFCAGMGTATPDIANASRRITLGEFVQCERNGVTDIVELRIGTDGVVFAAAANGGLTMDLTKAQIYEALAAEPYGEEQTAMMWSDVDSSLPEKDIYVYGPSDTSGTLASLRSLVMEAGCNQDSRMRGLQNTDADRHEDVCTGLRTDGSYREQGENDGALIGRIANNAMTIAVFGYSWYEENQDQVQALTIDGVSPNAETIASGAYPASRPLYIYVKKGHLEAIDGLAPYVAQWAASWGPEGALEEIGLVVSPDDVLEAASAAAADMPVLTRADLSEEGAESE